MINIDKLNYIKDFNISREVDHFSEELPPQAVQVAKGVVDGAVPSLLWIVPLALNKTLKTKVFSLPKLLWTAQSVILSIKTSNFADLTKKQAKLVMNALGFVDFCSVLPKDYTFLIGYAFVLTALFLTSRSLLVGGRKTYSGWQNRKKEPLDKTTALFVSGSLSLLIGAYGAKTLLHQFLQPRVFCSKHLPSQS